MLWDTSSPLTAPVDAADRAEWKHVPSDLLALEADPLKAEWHELKRRHRGF